MASEKTSELGNEDWAQLDSLLLLLQPLNDITKHLSTSKFPSISTVIPAYVAFIKQTQVVVKSNPSLRHAQSAIESKLEFYYHAALKKPVYTAATILDPRLKHSYFKGKNDSASIKKQFLKDSEPFSKYSSKQAATTSSSQMPQRTWINDIFKKSKTSSIEEEIKVYLGEPDSSEDVEPILYWKDQQNRFPCLSRMAKTHFSVPATSTPFERCFSGGRLICHHTRGSISSEKFSAPMCLNSWLKNGYQVQIMENDD